MGVNWEIAVHCGMEGEKTLPKRMQSEKSSYQTFVKLLHEEGKKSFQKSEDSKFVFLQKNGTFSENGLIL